jgi:ATP-binding cassette subfamily C protein
LSLHRSIGYSARALTIINEIQNVDSKNAISVKNTEKFQVSSEEAMALENVFFSYPDSHDLIFENFNFSVRRFDRVAIIGESGSGKSTLCDLMSGSVQPNEGSVKIFGNELRKGLESISETVMFLPQGAQLIRGTILENVSLEVGSDEIQIQRVNEALSNASLLDFIRTLPDGIKTVIGENGLKLSGGQVQRILIARSFYTNPDLLIYDEPTSSLDTLNSTYFDDYLQSLRGRVTIVYITHKDPNPNLFDYVYKLQNGQLHGVPNLA